MYTSSLAPVQVYFDFYCLLAVILFSTQNDRFNPLTKFSYHYDSYLVLRNKTKLECPANIILPISNSILVEDSYYINSLTKEVIMHQWNTGGIIVDTTVWIVILEMNSRTEGTGRSIPKMPTPFKRENDNRRSYYSMLVDATRHQLIQQSAKRWNKFRQITLGVPRNRSRNSWIWNLSIISSSYGILYVS